ncbi:unnamed protein product [Cylindrotheca closterium]|uniref:Uncharacterized protein n=1 Tax=Cylindrotheca closterium TaxID=2856 RepID=A0AAD2FU62_9STRA|nr:unnamed protein product [Cylindrotheca closterium]
MKISSIAVSASLLVSGTHAFVAQKRTQSIRSGSTPLFLEPSAITEYMVKAHEDKLKAVQQIETQKNEEIKALRAELSAAQQQASSSSSAITPAISGHIADMSKEELVQKLVAYQQFMSKYIVEAQQNKAKAVLAAENAMKQKYEEKLVFLRGTNPAPMQAAPTQASVDTKLYQERSEKVSAAAKAGKSRWGDMENKRAAQAATNVVAPAVVAQEVKPVSIEAPKGGDRSLYDKRISMVAAAGKAGKSRWGEMEVMKATTAATALPASTAAAPTKATPQSVTASKTVGISVPPEVAAADHGLRNDGGVGGPSLAERINLGAQLLQQGSAAVAPTSVAAPAVAPSASALSLFQKRNMMVAAAAKAGKSRWGDFEVKKAQSIVATLPSAAEAAPAIAVVATPPEVAAADHGLRNDGGVGGPSLADRVNLGASLLGK